MSPGVHLENLRGRATTRDVDEPHRASTPLELFFDLTFVVAVGRVATALAHELAADRVAYGLVGAGLVFFGIWWAWMNFTWFANAHDSDDVAFRLLTFVQISGALVFATGVERGVEERWFVVTVVGYVIMRVGLVLNWLRVARDEPASRARACRFAFLITAIQILWVGLLVLPPAWQPWAFVVLGTGELAIPIIAERSVVWSPMHPGHIEERYGLFTIILLGEAVLSAANGFQIAIDQGGLSAGLLTVGAGGLVVTFAIWWLYFDHPGHLAPTTENAFRWGYGHLVVFASIAAFGAGLHLASDAVADASLVDERTAALSVALPVACYLCGLVLLMMITGASLAAAKMWPKVVGAAVLVVVGSVASVSVTVVVCAVVVTALATAMVVVSSSSSTPEV